MRWALCRAGPLQDVRWLRRVARASRGAGVRAACGSPVRLAARTSFEVSVGAFALGGSSADGVLNLNAMGTSVMDAEMGLSLVEVIAIVSGSSESLRGISADDGIL